MVDMTTNMRQRIAVWILGFLTFGAFLNMFNSALMWTLNGSNHIFEPYYISQYIGDMQITHYFGFSAIAAFIFLGFTVVAMFRRSSYDINAITAQKAMTAKFVKAIDTNVMNHANLERYIHTTKADVFRTLKQQEEMLSYRITELREDVLKALEGHRSLTKKMATLNKVKADLDYLKQGLTNLETTLVLPNPILKADSNPKDIRGIGPTTTKELATMGITSAGEFLFADPLIIGEQTRLTQEKAESLQGMVQLLMIPAIDETDIELLERAGVKNRKELAIQDPFELHIQLMAIAKAYIKDHQLTKAQIPRLEEVISWVGLAKL